MSKESDMMILKNMFLNDVNPLDGLYCLLIRDIYSSLTIGHLVSILNDWKRVKIKQGGTQL